MLGLHQLWGGRGGLDQGRRGRRGLLQVPQGLDGLLLLFLPLRFLGCLEGLWEDLDRLGRLPEWFGGLLTLLAPGVFFRHLL